MVNLDMKGLMRSISFASSFGNHRDVSTSRGKAKMATAVTSRCIACITVIAKMIRCTEASAAPFEEGGEHAAGWGARRTAYPLGAMVPMIFS